MNNSGITLKVPDFFHNSLMEIEPSEFSSNSVNKRETSFAVIFAIQKHHRGIELAQSRSLISLNGEQRREQTEQGFRDGRAGDHEDDSDDGDAKFHSALNEKKKNRRRKDRLQEGSSS